MANTKITSGVIADDAITAALIADNAVGISALNVSDGSDGQALVTNGSGTLSFASVGVSGISSSADATAITIDSSEQVGIGTTSPSALLHVNSTSAVSNRLAIFESDINNTNEYSTISVGHNQLSANFGLMLTTSDTAYVGVGSSGNPFDPTTGTGLYVNANGNVGIGVSSPTSGAGWNRFVKIAGGTSNSVVLDGTDSQEADVGAVDGLYISVAGHTTGSNNKIIFRTQSADSNYNGIERMRITSDGKIGIGTTSPTVPLDVYNGSGWGGLDLDGTSGGELRLLKAGTMYGNLYASDSHGLVINAANGVADIFFQSGGSTKMSILDGGQILAPSQPAFDAGRNAGYVTDDQNFIQDSARTNVGSHYSTSTGRFTAPVAGQYLVMFRIFTHDSGGVVQAEVTLKKNGGNHMIFRAHKVGGYHTPVQGTKVITLAANDYIQTYVGDSGTSSGWMGSAAEYNYFCAFLIG